MQVREVTFSIEKTTPLAPLTKDPDDQYSNIKPRASVTITLERGESVGDAFERAQTLCLEQMASFHADFVAMLNG
jgi:hypothetical protein